MQGLIYVLVFKAHGPPFLQIPLSELYEFTGPSICIKLNSIYLIVKISPRDKNL